MGAKIGTKKYSDAKVKFIISEGEANLAQVAHRRTRPFDPTTAAKVLTALSQKLPESVALIVTGGGFVTLRYDETGLTYVARRNDEFLAKLRAWTEGQLKGLVESLHKVKGREFLVGVDVLVDGDGSGQFGLWVGPKGEALVSKRFPVGNESAYLAGVDTEQDPSGPRVVKSKVGASMVLVCHDAQAFNHFTKAKVDQATWLTPRKRGMKELRDTASKQEPKWMFDLIHSVSRSGNLRTFKTSFKQIHVDCLTKPSVVGAFGYGTGKAKQAAGWLAQLRQPPELNAVTVVIESR